MASKAPFSQLSLTHTQTHSVSDLLQRNVEQPHTEVSLIGFSQR